MIQKSSLCQFSTALRYIICHVGRSIHDSQTNYVIPFVSHCRLPLKRVFSFEPQEHHTYTRAHKAGYEGKDCVTMFPGCSFSLIDLALGRYNAPPSDHSGDLADYTGTFTEDEPFTNWPRYNMK